MEGCDGLTNSEAIVHQKVNGYFIYVRDLKRAINMYSKLFDFPVKEEEILFGHLYFMPNDIILDSNGMENKPIPEWLPVSIKLGTKDIDKSKDFVQELGFEISYGIDRGSQVSWFLFKDPDGNTLMMCQDH
jgi:predicted enzyme related to lactoylglutathione lyase